MELEDKVREGVGDGDEREGKNVISRRRVNIRGIRKTSRSKLK